MVRLISERSLKPEGGLRSIRHFSPTMPLEFQQRKTPEGFPVNSRGSKAPGLPQENSLNPGERHGSVL